MYNHNFNFRGNFTFQPFIPAPFPPPPPPPPLFFIPPTPVMPLEIEDTKVMKYYESRIPPKLPKPKTPVTISLLKDKLKSVLLLLNDVKSKENVLRENMNSYSDEEWSSKLKDIADAKKKITEEMNDVNETDFYEIRKMITSRISKRMRLKRQKVERIMDKEQRKKDREEKSRKIDEYLQRVKDELNKAKQVYGCFQ
ncbi:junction-mediating and -regulatory protein-like [Manduca sexta]|uniref:junction-mediating and -regulatory protein-like n=1 Tax=Manduca sexta TaxID=7130 RepID=UPI00188FAB0E|nr:junction-mediating and -regulatory protein-like [Manduca sexta]